MGLSNTLNVKIQVAQNSREYVSENKDTEIATNQSTIIHKDATKNIKVNRSEVVEGYEIHVKKKMQIFSEKEMDYKSKDNIFY